MPRSIYDIVRGQEEIDSVLNQLSDNENEGIQKYPGMSYEQGALAMFNWLTGASDDNPMED